MSWMVTGGAGYIGAHVVRAFEEVGLDVVVVDDLSSGHREFVHGRRPVRRGHHRRHRPDGARPCKEHDVEGVVHLAGFKYAGVSVDRPLHTYTQNVTGTVNLLEAMERTGADKMVFSSSAATFGTPDVDLGHRGDRDAPRVAVRREQADRRVGDPRPGRRHRACGTPRCATSTSSARAADDLYDTSPHNLFPIVFESCWPAETPADQRRRLRHA